MNRILTILFALANSTLLAGPPAVLATGCGGCYALATIESLATTPATSCIALSASEVSPCTGGYLVTVTNSCTEPLALTGGATIAAGSRLDLDNEVWCPADGSCEVKGTLGTTPVSISWVVHPE